jgi:hypothetical protein
MFNRKLLKESYTIMRRIKFMIKQFLKEPLWFKTLISVTLLSSIVFSSSFFLNDSSYQSVSKLAAPAFFCAYGIKMQRNRVNSIFLFAAAIICVCLAVWVHY